MFTHIVGRFVNPNNDLGPIVELVQVSPKRASGFPKLLLSDVGTVLAWTDQTEDFPRVSTVLVNVSIFR